MEEDSWFPQMLSYVASLSQTGYNPDDIVYWIATFCSREQFG